jgi:hypothetical protein
MSERVAVYIDFDNVVISRYDDIHGTQAWRKDDPRKRGRSANSTDPIDVKLAAAQVDIGAIIDYAASFGSVSLSRAYADWSVPANAAYKEAYSQVAATESLTCSDAMRDRVLNKPQGRVDGASASPRSVVHRLWRQERC